MPSPKPPTRPSSSPKPTPAATATSDSTASPSSFIVASSTSIRRAVHRERSPDYPHESRKTEISCSDVCSEYQKSNSQGVEVGYTCDATLCTASVEDAGLVAE